MKFFITLFFIGLTSVFSNEVKPSKNIDIIKVMKSQTIISENILENYFLQESIDLSESIEKDKAQFQQNLDLLYSYFQKENNTVKELIKSNSNIWSEFKKTTEQPISESSIEKLIKLSTDLLLINEHILIVSERTLFEELNPQD